MGIYLGTWKDAGGVGLDPAAFSIKVTEASGPTPTLTVTGDPDPDCTGTYTYLGEWEGWPYFKHDTKSFYCYHPDYPYGYRIHPALQPSPYGYWVAAETSPFGPYGAEGPGAGSLEVALDTPFHLIISGNPDPDCTAIYAYAGLSDDQPYWQDPTETWCLYYQQWQWWISTELGTQPADRWRTDGILFVDSYVGEGVYTGTCVATLTPIPAIPGGLFRLRIHGRRHGSGPRPDYYPATPNMPAGHYDFSPWQYAARRAFEQVTRHYVVKPEQNLAILSGTPEPPITGPYGSVEPVYGPEEWASSDTGYTIYWHPGTATWIISTMPHDLPGYGDIWWQRNDPDPTGIYQPQDMAVGTVTLAYG